MSDDKKGGRKPKGEKPIQTTASEAPAEVQEVKNVVAETSAVIEVAPKTVSTKAKAKVEAITVVLIGKPGPQRDAARDLWKKHFKETFHLLYLETATCKDIKDLISDGALGQKFILATDSALAVNDFSLAEVKFPKQTADGHRDTGLPVLLYSAKSQELLENFDPQAPVSVLIEAYCRSMTIPPLTLDLMTDNLKCGIYRSNPRMSIVDDAFKKKIWLHVTREGWTPIIAKMISDHIRGNG